MNDISQLSALFTAVVVALVGTYKAIAAIVAYFQKGKKVMAPIENLYVIRDKVAKDCGPVFQAVNDEVAARSYRDLISSVQEKSRPDFELLKIGTIKWDGNTIAIEHAEGYNELVEVFIDGL